MTNPTALLAPAVARAITFEAFLASRRLRRYGYQSEDILQELLLHWLRRHRRYNPRRSAPATFAARVCRNRAIALFQAAAASKRGGSLVYSFCELPRFWDDGRQTERLERISMDTQDMRLGLRSRTEGELHDLQMDVAKAIATLPPKLAVLAHELKFESVVGAARSAGISRSAAHRHMHTLRDVFIRAGLDAYVTQKPNTQHQPQSGAPLPRAGLAAKKGRTKEWADA